MNVYLIFDDDEDPLIILSQEKVEDKRLEIILQRSSGFQILIQFQFIKKWREICKICWI